MVGSDVFAGRAHSPKPRKSQSSERGGGGSGHIATAGSLASLRQKYVSANSEQSAPASAAKLSPSAKLDAIKEEEADDARERTTSAPSDNAPRLQGSTKGEDDEEEALLKMWDEATAANREVAARPSPWMCATAEPIIGFADAWQKLAALAAEESLEPAPDVAGLDSAPSREKDEIVAIARTKLCEENIMHLRVLQSVWRRLADTTDVPLRVSAQWQDIGFQGTDPSTDLRGTGLLGLVHLLALGERTPAELKAGIAAARHPTRHFPFAVASFNFSKLAVECLLDGKLTAVCNKAQCAECSVTALYLGAFRTFLTRWQKDSLRIEDFGNVLKELTALAAKNPQKLIQEGERRE